MVGDYNPLSPPNLPGQWKLEITFLCHLCVGVYTTVFCVVTTLCCLHINWNCFPSFLRSPNPCIVCLYGKLCCTIFSVLVSPAAVVCVSFILVINPGLPFVLCIVDACEDEWISLLVIYKVVLLLLILLLILLCNVSLKKIAVFFSVMARLRPWGHA